MESVARTVYYLTYPMLALYFRGSVRTRVVLRRRNEVLLVRTYLSSGSWDLPGGGVHKGETVVDAAVREVHEELGIAIDVQRLEKLKGYGVSSGLIRFDVVPFRIQYTSKRPLRLQRLEIVEARWVKRKDLKDLRLAQGVNELVLRCLKG